MSDATVRTVRFIFNVIYSGDKNYTILDTEKYLQTFKRASERGQKQQRTLESDDEEDEEVSAEKNPKENHFVFVQFNKNTNNAKACHFLTKHKIKLQTFHSQIEL